MPPQLQAFFDGITIADVLIVLAGAGAIFASVKWVVPFARKAINFFDDVAGEPARAGVPARPGLMARMGTVEEVLAQVKHEVLPNTGTSARDAIDRTELGVEVLGANVGELQTAMVDVHAKLDNDNQRIAGISDRLDEHITQSTQIINQLRKENHEHPE